MSRKISLTDEVLKLLQEHNPSGVEVYKSHIEGRIYENLAMELSDQNQYWRLQLGMLEHDTIIERLCLDNGCAEYDGGINTWLKNFKLTVIPLIVEHNLPKYI